MYYLEQDLFRKTIQKLTFTYCIPLETLCYSGSRMENLYHSNFDEAYYTFGDSTLLYKNAHKRYARLLGRLCIENYSNTFSTTFLLEKEKIYDKFMFESQVNLYNSLSKAIGYAPIEKILPFSLIRDAAFLDNALPDYETITKYYPYYPPDKREGVNFIEFILILNIYLAIRSGSLDMLNKTIVSKRSRKRLDEIVTSVVESINSKEIFPLYVYAFFDMLDKERTTIHNLKAKEFIYTSWLPEKYKSRVDVFRAFEAHKKSERKLPIGQYKENQIDDIMTNGSLEEQSETINATFDYQFIEDAEAALAISFRLLLNVPFEIEITPDEPIYKLALEYENIMRSYIETSQLEAANIFKKIYIEQM